ERRESREHRKGVKQARLTITREQVLRLDPGTLPPDAVRKGYEDVVVQDVVFRADTIRFRKEQWDARSTGRTYLAPLPPGYQGQFGPGVKSLALALYYGGQMSEAKILGLFADVGLVISAGQVSNLVVKGQDDWHAEAEAIYRAGLASSPWQHVDETPTRLDGRNQHCHVVGNPLSSAYHTTPGKDRLSALDVLRDRQQRTFRLNREALGYLEQVGLAKWIRHGLAGVVAAQAGGERDLDEAALDRLLAAGVPGIGPQQRKWVLDATAVAAYHAQLEFPVVQVLVCDDAPQFTWLTQQIGLCWVHDGRHYIKLEPSVPHFRTLLTDFRRDYWTYYRQLLAYRQDPTPEERGQLAARFDDLFSTVTGYSAWDDRIAKTRAKRDCLLLVLDHPELPLHNNPAELAARARVRKRDVSFGPRTDDGLRAWDTFGTLAATATKLGVSLYHYFQDRLSGAPQRPSLASLITRRAPALHLADSWNSS
ncbi:MAG: IS66 family transposase, partial [Chloroflexota bacterium]